MDNLSQSRFVVIKPVDKEKEIIIQQIITKKITKLILSLFKGRRKVSSSRISGTNNRNQKEHFSNACAKSTSGVLTTSSNGIIIKV